MIEGGVLLNDTQLLRLHDCVDGTRTSMICEYGLKNWNDTAREKPKYSERSLPNCQFIHHRCHMYWPVIEPTPSR